MMSWLRANLATVLIVFAVGAAIAGLTARAHYLGVAEVHAARADSAQAVADRVGRANVAMARELQAERRAYTADSVRWARREADSRARIAALSRDAQRTADDLRARLDSVGTRLLDEYEAQVDSILAIKDERISDLEEERASLWAQRESMQSLIGGLQAEADGLREVNASLRSANDALRKAAGARGLFSFDFTRDPWLVGAGAVIGYLAAGGLR